MTLAALEKRVARLQTALNLDHWNLDVKIVEEMDYSPGAAACVIRSTDYDLAEIRVAQATLDTHSEFELDVALAHELLHIHFRDLDNVTELMTEIVPEGARVAYTAWLAHEQEGVVDRLARAVVTCLTA
jgi:hypothetical protein